MPLANRIKEIRARHNLTQTDLAKLVGVSRQTIGLMEKEDYSPSVVLAIKTSRVFESSVEEVFIKEGQKKKFLNQEDFIEYRQKNCETIIFINSMNYIAIITWMFFLIGSKYFYIGLAFFISSLALELCLLNRYKSIRDLNLNIFSFKTDKGLFAQIDEGERWLEYKASRRSYLTTEYTCILVSMALLTFRSTYNISSACIFPVILIWIVHRLAYHLRTV